MPKASASADASPCLLVAWRAHQGELRGWLAHQLADRETAHDLLQDVFLKALRQGAAFCDLNNPRAWLFEVARNTLTDHRRHQPPVDGWSPEQLDRLPQPDEALPVVDQLTGCLCRVLGELDEADADIIRQCDLQGLRQQDYATQHGLSLPATKARLRRARERLRAAMTRGCQIQSWPGGGVADFVPR